MGTPHVVVTVGVEVDLDAVAGGQHHRAADPGMVVHQAASQPWNGLGDPLHRREPVVVVVDGVEMKSHSAAH